MRFGLQRVVSFGTEIAQKTASRFALGRFRAREKSNRSTRITVDRIDATDGIGGDWAATKHGEYYATSAAVARPPLLVEKRVEMSGDRGRAVSWVPIDIDHRLQTRSTIPIVCGVGRSSSGPSNRTSSCGERISWHRARRQRGGARTVAFAPRPDACSS